MSKTAAGRDAIDAALDRLYPPDIVDLRATPPPRPDGTASSLVEVAIFPGRGTGRSHWHYISYGLSEIFDKQTNDLSTSGFGLELTLRLARGPEDQPPLWPVSMLVRVADYVFDEGFVVAPLHTMGLETIGLRPEPSLAALVFADEPLLPPIQSVHGRLRFVQAFGITEEEEDLIRRWSVRGFLDEVRMETSLLVTDPTRRSVLSHADRRRVIEARVQADGSSQEVEVMADLVVRAGIGMGAAVELDMPAAKSAHILATLLRGRLPYQRQLVLVCSQDDIQRVIFVSTMPGHEAYSISDGDQVHLGVPPERIQQLASDLMSGRHDLGWDWFPELRVRVEP